MNVETGTEVSQFPEKEYVNGIFVAVWLEKRYVYTLPEMRKSYRYIFIV